MRAEDYIESLLQQIVQEQGLSWPDKALVEPPRDKQFGDVACNVALVLAKEAKARPRDLATSLGEAALERGAELQAVDVAGPGFLNFTLKPAFWQKTVNEILDRAVDFGRHDLGKGAKVQIEYVSANPTGPLHIGHGRGAALGDSLARILRFTGFEVGTEYYINDAGRQMLLLGGSVWARCQELLGRNVELPEDGYKGDYIREIATRALAAHPELETLEDADEALEICKNFAMQDILDGIRADLEAFGVEHQVWFSEKSLVDSGEVQATLADLERRDLAYEQEGALWFRSTEFGDDKDRVLRKSNGYLTYLASDIAYHDNKFRRGFTRLVDIWGADHHGYVPRMKGAIQALGRNPDDFHVVLVQLVNLLRGGEQVAMSTRAGTFETLADVVAEVGADAARFIFLSRKSDSPLDFDLELVKQKTMDNPVYYVQYAHARICSLMHKAEERGLALEPEARASEAELALLDTPEDMELLRLAARFPDALDSASTALSPHFVSFYLQELASQVHRYYTVHQVLGADDDSLVRARLLLLAAVAHVIRNGLALLGVSAPERM